MHHILKMELQSLLEILEIILNTFGLYPPRVQQTLHMHYMVAVAELASLAN
jgi:hypothetical protein